MGEDQSYDMSTTKSRTRKYRRTRHSTTATFIFRVIVVCWLSILSYWIFCEKNSSCQHHSSSFPTSHSYITSKTQRTLSPSATPNSPKNTIVNLPAETLPSLPPTPTATPKRKYPTIYLLRTRESRLTSLQNYITSALDPNIVVLPLEYNSKDKEFYSMGNLVTSSLLQKSITLFVFQ